MIGTFLNTAAILVGGAVGLTVARDISPKTQLRLKTILAAFIIYAGLSTTWNSLNGSLGQVARQIAIILLALILGNATGKVLRLQKGINRLGLYAKEQFQQAQTSSGDRPS